MRPQPKSLLHCNMILEEWLLSAFRSGLLFCLPFNLSFWSKIVEKQVLRNMCQCNSVSILTQTPYYPNNSWTSESFNAKSILTCILAHSFWAVDSRQVTPSPFLMSVQPLHSLRAPWKVALAELLVIAFIHLWVCSGCGFLVLVHGLTWSSIGFCFKTPTPHFHTP